MLDKASVNALIKLAFSDAGSGGVGCGGPPQHKGIGAVCPYVGCITGVTKGGAMLVVVLKGLTGMLQLAMLCTHLQGGMADSRVSCAWG